MSTTAGYGQTDDDIVLAFPAWRTNLRIARMAVSSVAADAGFGLEDIEDLRVAVTELCGALLGPPADEAGDGDLGRIELRFRVDAGDVVLLGRRHPAPGPAPVLDPIARELLAVITDHHVLEAVDGRWSF